MCCRCCGFTQQKVWVFGIGSVLVILGLVNILWWPTWAEDIVFNALPLSPQSRTFDKWMFIPVPIYFYMYLFNWTNPEQVIQSGAKPHFDQVGPYVFREERRKEDLIWHENKTVTFYGKRTWFHEPELSGGSLDDLVTCPHLPSIAAASVMRDKPAPLKLFFNYALNQNGGALYQTHTANEWLFEGFYDEFLHYSMSLNSSLAPPVESDEFAWFYGRNGSKEYEGTFTIHTGQGDLRQMGDLKFWNGQNHTGFYEGDCGRINGSTSELWVPNRAAHEYITLFITDTCRIINLVPTNETVTVEGVRGVMYETRPDTFDNGENNSDMKCYCPVERQPSNCPKSGATDLSKCAYGAPMYLSHAHFMYADPSYADTITGMQPDENQDKFFIIMEPKLGIPLQVNATVQISLHVRRDKDITILKSIQDFYAPLFITGSRAKLDRKLAREINLALSLPKLGRNFGIGFLVFGGAIIIIGLVLILTGRWQSQNQQKNNV